MASMYACMHACMHAYLFARMSDGLTDCVFDCSTTCMAKVARSRPSALPTAYCNRLTEHMRCAAAARPSRTERNIYQPRAQPVLVDMGELTSATRSQSSTESNVSNGAASFLGEPSLLERLLSVYVQSIFAN